MSVYLNAAALCALIAGLFLVLAWWADRRDPR